MDYEKNKRYFDLKEPNYSNEDNEYKQGIKYIVIAVAVELVIAITYFKGFLGFLYDLILAIPKNIGAILLILGWLIFVGIGALKIYLSKKTREEKRVEYESKIVNDEEYDKNSFSPILNLREQALEYLGVDEDEITEAAPIVLSSYVLNGWSRAKKGEDGYWRTDVVECIFLCFTSKSVQRYTLRYNTLTEKKQESSELYFYQDIVSIACSSETAVMSHENSKEEVTYETVILKTTGGVSFSIGLRDRANVRKSINAMMHLIAEKKESK